MPTYYDLCLYILYIAIDSMAQQFGPGILEPFIKDVECSGSESTLSDCTHQAANESDHSCYPTGVMCERECHIRYVSPLGARNTPLTVLLQLPA